MARFFQTMSYSNKNATALNNQAVAFYGSQIRLSVKTKNKKTKKLHTIKSAQPLQHINRSKFKKVKSQIRHTQAASLQLTIVAVQ
jgi:hypothetical protein